MTAMLNKPVDWFLFLLIEHLTREISIIQFEEISK